jgi:hypothetical protein
MPKKFIDCVKKVQKKIKEGKIPKHYDGKQTSAYAICRIATNYRGTTHEIGLIHKIKKRRKRR